MRLAQLNDVTAPSEKPLRSRVGSRRAYAMPAPRPAVKRQRNFVQPPPGASTFKGGIEYAIHRSRKAIRSIDVAAIDIWLANKVAHATGIVEPPVWLSNASNIEADISLSEISNTVSSLLKAISEKGTRHVSFHALNPSRGRAEHLVAILRSSFPWRSEIGGWRDFERAVRNELLSRQMEVDKIMRGLDR